MRQRVKTEARAHAMQTPTTFPSRRKHSQPPGLGLIINNFMATGARARLLTHLLLLRLNVTKEQEVRLFVMVHSSQLLFCSTSKLSHPTVAIV